VTRFLALLSLLVCLATPALVAGNALDYRLPVSSASSSPTEARQLAEGAANGSIERGELVKPALPATDLFKPLPLPFAASEHLPLEFRWEYAWSFDNAAYQLLNYEFVRERLGGSGKLSYYAGFGPAVGTKIGDERPLYGLAGNARAQYATGGAFAYLGVSGYGLFEQQGPVIGRMAFVAGFGWSFK